MKNLKFTKVVKRAISKEQVMIVLLCCMLANLSCKESNATDENANQEKAIEQMEEERGMNTSEFLKTLDSEAIELNNYYEIKDSVPLKDIDVTTLIAETPSFTYRTGGAKSPNYLVTGDGYRNLYFKFTDSNWSNITNTCGWNEQSNRFFTAPWPQFNKYQMFIMSKGRTGGWLMYPSCNENSVYYIKTKPGHRYYIYVNDEDGKHDDNHGTISWAYGLE